MSHDGTIAADAGADLLAILRLRGPDGMTLAEAVAADHGKPARTRSETERTRRKLERYVRDQVAQCFTTGGRGGQGETRNLARWVAVSEEGSHA